MRLTFIFLLFASLLQAQSNFLNATFKVDSASFVSNYNYILHGKVNGIGYGGDDANIGDRLIFMKDETCGELQIDSVLAASTFYLRVRVFSVDSLFDASPFGVGVLTGKTPNNDFRSSTINASNDLINCIENRFKLEVDAIDVTLPDSLIYGKGDPDWVAVFSPNDSTIKAGNIRDDGVDITFALPEVAYGIDDTSTPDAGTYGYNGATGRFAYYNAGWRNLISGNVTQNYLMRADANGNAVNAGIVDDGTFLQLDRLVAFKSYTTAGLPTGIENRFLWNSTLKALGWHNGTRYAYAPESTKAIFGAARVPYADANGQLTDDSDFTFQDGRLTIGYRNTSSFFINAGNTTQTGALNTGIGYQAFQSLTSATANTAIGAVALRDLTSGASNTAVGRNALSQITTGASNVAIGATAQSRNNVSGIVAIGQGALFDNFASDIVGIGRGALQVNQGVNNIGIGALSMNLNTTGANTTAIGGRALELNTTGSENTAIGYLSLSQNTTANQGTAIGTLAMQFNVSGSNNQAVGYAGLRYNVSGQFNTSYAANGILGNTDQNYNTALGYNAYVGVSYLDTVSVIAVNTSTERLTLASAIDASITAGRYFVATTIGGVAGGYINNNDYLFQLIDSVTVQAVGININSTGTLPWSLQVRNQYENSTAVGANSIPDRSNQVVLGDNQVSQLKSGNYRFNVDQTIGVSQDNYVLTYDHATTEISLEAAPAGYTGFTPAADATVGDNVESGDTLTVSGGYGINTSVSGTTITVEADTSANGLATQYDLTQAQDGNGFFDISNDGDTIPSNMDAVLLNRLYFNNLQKDATLRIIDSDTRVRLESYSDNNEIAAFYPTNAVFTDIFNYTGAYSLNDINVEGISTGRQFYVSIDDSLSINIQKSTTDEVLSYSEAADKIDLMESFKVARSGTAEHTNYGAGNKEAADLGKTASGYVHVPATDGTLLEMSYANLETNLATTRTEKQSFAVTIYDGDTALPDSSTAAGGLILNKGFFRVPERMDGWDLNVSFGIFDFGTLTSTHTYSVSLTICDGSNANCTNGATANFTLSSERELSPATTFTVDANDIVRVNVTAPSGCPGGCGTESVNGLTATYTLTSN